MMNLSKTITNMHKLQIQQTESADRDFPFSPNNYWGLMVPYCHHFLF